MHQFKLQRSTIAVGLACAAVLTLSGCAATSITGSTAVPAAEASAKKMKAEPVKISMPVVDAFRGSGIFFFDDNVRSRLYISDTIAVNGRLPLKEEAPRGVAKGFTWGAGAATILRNGEPQPLTSPQALSVEKSGNVRLHYPPLKAKNAKPMSLSIKLIAYDLSGLPIGPYLKTRAGKSTPAGWLIANRYVFPEGSVGYRTVASVDETEVLVPTQKAFTGSAQIEDFSQRFAKDIPYCLRFIPNRDAEPLGLRFPKAIVKQTKTVKLTRGHTRTEEVAQSGEAMLYPVKKNTLFCAAEGSQTAAAQWNLQYVNGTRVISFTFPDEVSPANYGFLKTHRDALRLAFAEERVKQRGKTTTQVRPAALWLAGKPVLDEQWRFNAVAADAVSDAIRLTADQRAAWEAEQKAQSRAK